MGGSKLNDSFGLAWLVLLLPLAAFLVLALAGNRLQAMLGKRALGAIAVIPLAISFLISILLTKNLAGLDSAHRMVVVPGAPWIDIKTLSIPFELIVDPLSLTMALIITGIGCLIFLYSTGYMAEEREYSRFFTYMNLFAVSMLLLVLGNNLPLLFIGWEGVGLCSYLLIGFWYKDIENAKAANKAFIVNRIGDWGLTLGIFMILVIVIQSGKTIPDHRYFSYDTMLPALKVGLLKHPWLATSAALLLFVGACGKSAQFPLYLWLPDAMAGPTPVSALIHAATMVTSGVVLLNRMHVVFEMSEVASAVVCGVGAFTALFAAVVAFGQTDIKKVLAYSTVSQLGFMFIGAGAGSYWSGMFHVTTHAFFKALLFLGAGAVIHAMAHNQDLRNYGNLRKYLPITTWTMVIGWLAISAVPGLSGYYSKEALIGAAIAGSQAKIGDFNVGYWSGWLGLFVAILTAAYMTRLTWLTFFGNQERWRTIQSHEAGGANHSHSDPSAPGEVALPPDPHGFFLTEAPEEEVVHDHGLTDDYTPREVPSSMWVPLVVLAALSLFGGFVLANNHLLENWLAPSSGPWLVDAVAEVQGINLPAISMGAALLGLIAGYWGYRKGLPASEGWDDSTWARWRLSARNQFGFDAAVTDATVEGGAELAEFAWRGVDEGFIDRGVNGIAGLAAVIGGAFSSIQRGLIRSYALLMLLGGIAIVGYMTFALSSLHAGVPK